MANQTGQAGDPQLNNGEPLPGNGEEPPVDSSATTPVLSAAQVKQLVDEALAAQRETSSRALQSQLDKRDRNILERIEAIKRNATKYEESAKKTGVEASTASAISRNMVQAEIDAILEESQAPDQTQPNEADEAQQVTEFAQSLIGVLGLTNYDPEMRQAFANMRAAKNAEEYIKAIRDAHEAKIIRLKGGKAEPPPPNPARIAGLGADGGRRTATNPIEKIKNAGELYKLAEKQRTGRG